MEQSLEGASSVNRQPKRTYSARYRLRREMIGDHPVYSLFVSGSSTGAGEFSRHFFGERHWYADVTHRNREGLPVFNRLMDPVELSAEQIADFRSLVKVSLRGSASRGLAAGMYSCRLNDPFVDDGFLSTGIASLWGQLSVVAQVVGVFPRYIGP